MNFLFDIFYNEILLASKGDHISLGLATFCRILPHWAKESVHFCSKFIQTGWREG